MLQDTVPPTDVSTIQLFPNRRHPLDTLQSLETHLFFPKPPENEKETPRHFASEIQIAFCGVTGLWPHWQSDSFVFQNWIFFKIWLIKHRDIHFIDILLMWLEKMRRRVEKGYNLAYDPCNVTHLWYLIQTSGTRISLWNFLRAFLYIWIKYLYNFCSSYVKLCFVRRGQTSLMFTVLCPKPLLRRCPVPGPEQGLAPNLPYWDHSRPVKYLSVCCQRSHAAHTCLPCFQGVQSLQTIPDQWNICWQSNYSCTGLRS